jgi:hypothetical protein
MADYPSGAFVTATGVNNTALESALWRDGDHDPGVVLLQQGECFVPFHLIVPPNIEVLSAQLRISWSKSAPG